MAPNRQLDFAGRSQRGQVRFRLGSSLLFLFLLASPCLAADTQQKVNDDDRLASAKRAYSEKNWEETVRISTGPAKPATQSAELDYFRGMALMHLDRWKEAREAFSAGQ